MRGREEKRKRERGIARWMDGSGGETYFVNAFESHDWLGGGREVVSV